MAKKANPTAVGGFVIGALALLVAGTILIGRGRFFRDDLRFVCYFNSSVAGLDVGAPVRFNGVRVGEVADVRAVWSLENGGIHTPVTLSFREGAIRPPRGATAQELRSRDSYEIMDRLIEAGLRAELLQDSFVTGKLYVALRSYPDAPLELRGGTEYPEIPTREAGLVRFAKSIEDLPIEDLVNELLLTVRSVREVTGDPELRRMVASMRELLDSVQAEVGPLASSTSETLATVRDAIAAATETISTANSELSTATQGLRKNLEPLAESLEETLAALRRTLGRVDGTLGEDSDVVHRTVLLLEDLAEAARSISGLARTLERNPESLISGKPQR